jgi:uracil-DNA glycosylase family 4
MPLPVLSKLPPIPLADRPKGCSNCIFGGMKVGGRGPIDSPFVIVGESPGANELARGYPFVGPSGKMLEDVLTELGCTTEPYITNALQCFPRKKEQDVMGKAVSACRSRLHDEIAQYPRKVILTLGGPAAQSLLDDLGFKVTQKRGQRFKHPLAQHGIVSAVHPAFLMRQGSGFGDWKRDIKLALDLVEDKEPDEWEPPAWWIVQNRDEYLSVYWSTTMAKEAAGDIETSGFDFQRNYILSMGITTDLSEGTAVAIIPNRILWANEDITRELMELPQIKWVWQNGKFDIKFFRHEGINARVDEDTMLLSYTLDESRGKHDLDKIAYRELNAPNHKKVIDEWFIANGIKKADRTYDKIPKPLLYRYQAFDISKTFQAYKVMRPKVAADHNLEKLYTKLMIPGSECLAKIEQKGMLFDPEMHKVCAAEVEERLKGPREGVQVYARQYLNHEINLNSPRQVGNLLYNCMKLGNPGSSTDEDSIIEIKRKHNHPIAQSMLEYRGEAKLESTYVRPAPTWVGLDHRIHSTYLLHGTITGRLASREPNLQNIPRGPFIRRMFKAADGRIYVECDLNQAELRSLAIMSADPTLLRIYTENLVSIHHVTAVAFYGEDYDDEQKMRAKAVNFGIVYGRTAPSLAQEFNISIQEAQSYIDAWFARYPKAKEFIMSCRKAPQLGQTMITVFGRKKRWGVVSNENMQNVQNEASNYPHQSTASDITLMSAIEVQPVLKEKWDADVVNLIHDAIYFEVANDPAIFNPAIKYVTDVMQRVPRDWGLTRVPFLAEAKTGTSWGSMKSYEGWKEAA